MDFLVDDKHNPHGKDGPDMTCRPVDFREGKLYEIIEGKCTVLNDLESDFPYQLDTGTIFMFLEAVETAHSYDKYGIKLLVGDNVVFFTGALCSANFKKV